MLSFKYLQGVYFERMEGLHNIFLIPHGKDRRSFRLVCSYFDGKTRRPQIIRKLRKMGRGAEVEHLQLHHLVEPVHFAEIDFSGQFNRWIQYELPCVFLSRREHQYYNHFLNIPPQDEKFRDTPPMRWMEKSKETVQRTQHLEAHETLIARWENLLSFYHVAYERDEHFQKITRNIFEEVKRYLPKPPAHLVP